MFAKKMRLTALITNQYLTLSQTSNLLVTSNFSFSHSVFERLILQTCKKQGLFGIGFTNKVQHAEKKWKKKAYVTENFCLYRC